MQKDMQLAGFLAAHAVSTLSEGDHVNVVYGKRSEDDKLELVKPAGYEMLSEAIDSVVPQLGVKEPEIVCKTIVHDGSAMAMRDNKSMNVITVMVGLEYHGLVFAIPYTPADSSGGFSIRTLKVVKCPDHLLPKESELVKYFFAGFDTFPQGFLLWKKYFRGHWLQRPRNMVLLVCAIGAAIWWWVSHG